MRLVTEASQQGYSLNYKSNRFFPDLLEAIGTKTKEQATTLTDADIQNARRASFGLALEAAYQMGQDDMVRTGRLNDHTEWWSDLELVTQDATTLSESLRVQDPDGYRTVALRVAAAIEGISSDDPRLANLSDEKLHAWVEGTMDDSLVRIRKKKQALQDYLTSGR